jgi:hypothetical protein
MTPKTGDMRAPLADKTQRARCLPYPIRTEDEGESMSSTQYYEIFKKAHSKYPVLVETIVGLENAKRRLRELDHGYSDIYFIFDCQNACLIVPLKMNYSANTGLLM